MDEAKLKEAFSLLKQIGSQKYTKEDLSEIDKKLQELIDWAYNELKEILDAEQFKGIEKHIRAHEEIMKKILHDVDKKYREIYRITNRANLLAFLIETFYLAKLFQILPPSKYHLLGYMILAKSLQTVFDYIEDEIISGDATFSID